MNKYRKNFLARQKLFYSRYERAERTQPLYFQETARISMAAFIIVSLAIYAALEGILLGFYFLLDNAGVFAAIFKFMG